MTSRRRSSPLLAPEVVQSSALDCGPAALACVLRGFGLPADYEQLRDACQTDVDGTSIDAVEEVAGRRGLAAEQIIVPVDHVLLSEAAALPAIVIVRLPSGFTHFVVVWCVYRGMVQVMDPARGRRWTTRERFVEELYQHAVTVPASAWREWAGGLECSGALRQRMRVLRVPGAAAERLLACALAAPGWTPLATLDAAIRMVAATVRAGGLRTGREATAALGRLANPASQTATGEAGGIASGFWAVRPAVPEIEGAEQVLLRGAVLVRVRGRSGAAVEDLLVAAPDSVASSYGPSPWAKLRHGMAAEGRWVLAGLLTFVVLSAAGAVAEVVLLRGLLSPEPPGVSARVGQVASVLLLVLVNGGLVRLPMIVGLLRSGQRWETRVRSTLYGALRLLPDAYFRSRLVSDLAERAHSVHQLRLLPGVVGQLLLAAVTLVFTTAALIWLDPMVAVPALLAAAATIGVPLAAQPILAERDLRARSHAGALSRFHLDGLLGLTTIRAHAAERAVRREHEALVLEWARARLALHRTVTAAEAVQTTLSFGFAVWLVLGHLQRQGPDAATLLVVYWALSLPVLGGQIALLARGLPTLRNILLRLLEPLHSAGGQVPAMAATTGSPCPLRPDQQVGVRIELDDVSVELAGRTVLAGVSTKIPAGSHVAVVGPSGAGKSTLVGLLLGWYQPVTGRLLVDEHPLEREQLDRLRAATAWVDPTVQLWNQSLLDNLRYGLPGAPAPVDRVLELADLHPLLAALGDGLHTRLGENGALVSGGEGQRVRLARALLNPAPRLVILDEPFRGLDATQRRELLTRARTHWKGSTLLCVTHDITDSASFDRVLVLDGGVLVEDDAPGPLAARPGSRYAALLAAERRVHDGRWLSDGWRRVRLHDGRVVEAPRYRP